ncbi:MAG TPA: SRPBCC domain-containing protein [Gaiellaceae bacterium]|nr:SRPBCC domain-containing protein [Gaiellaceae bacterium]
MNEASLELLAPRVDVWSFLAEPYHLSDWWPGITGVDPDVRGFAPGARWKVHSTKRNIFTGRRSVETMVLIREIDPYERWTWHLLEPATDVEVHVRAVEDDRTLVRVVVSRGNPSLAVKRLYDLVQTAAEL